MGTENSAYNLNHLVAVSLFFSACALAELVDNALSATAKNTEVKSIEIRLVGSAFYF